MDAPVLGKKIGMSQIFSPDGTRTGVTIVKVAGCIVVDKRTMERDGYTALVVGIDEVTGDPRRVERLVGKPMMGRYKKLGVEPQHHLVEFRVTEKDLEKYTVGQKIGAEAIKEGDRLDVSATSKGDRKSVV